MHLADLVESPIGGTFELNGTRYTTLSVFIHEDYNRFTLENDIAIYELREVVDGVQPSPIYTGTPRVGQEVTLVGYGAGGDGNTGQDGTFGVKMVGTTTIDVVTQTKVVWFFDDNDESNTAYGDSGGPAFLYVDGEFLVAGVTSAGSTPDRVIGDVAISTRVDAFTEWIDSVVATVDDGTVDDGTADDGDDDTAGEGDGPQCEPGNGKVPGYAHPLEGSRRPGQSLYAGFGKPPGHGFRPASFRPATSHSFRPGVNRHPR